jgi:hypothetical protein
VLRTVSYVRNPVGVGNQHQFAPGGDPALEEKPRVVELRGRVRLEFYREQKALRMYTYWYEPAVDEERRGKPVILYAEEIAGSEECWRLLEEFVGKARPKEQVATVKRRLRPWLNPQGRNLTQNLLIGSRRPVKRSGRAVCTWPTSRRPGNSRLAISGTTMRAGTLSARRPLCLTWRNCENIPRRWPFSRRC